MNINLSAPSFAIFVISAVLAALAVLGLVAVGIPVISGNSFLLLAIAYGVLLFGVLFRGA